MHVKKSTSVILMLLLALLITGCGCDPHEVDPKYESKPYTGSPNHLVGTYILALNVRDQNAANKLFGTEDVYHGKTKQRMDISVKDPNTLTAKFGAKGEPFDLVFDRKTGKAKGTDGDGHKWEIQFNSEKSGSDNILVMKSVTREKNAVVGLRSTRMNGYSETGVPYNGN